MTHFQGGIKEVLSLNYISQIRCVGRIFKEVLKRVSCDHQVNPICLYQTE